MRQNKVWMSVGFQGFWPVGTAAIVVAQDEDQARELLRQELTRIGLAQNDFTVEEVDLKHPRALVLNDGNY